MPQAFTSTQRYFRRQAEPPLLRFFATQALIGWIVAVFLIGLLLWTNPSDIRGILLQAEGHPWPLVMLWFFIGMTCGGVQIGAALALDRETRPPH